LKKRLCLSSCSVLLIAILTCKSLSFKALAFRSSVFSAAASEQFSWFSKYLTFGCLCLLMGEMRVHVASLSEDFSAHCSSSAPGEGSAVWTRTNSHWAPRQSLLANEEYLKIKSEYSHLQMVNVY
jgi:hypothetical protein